MYTSEYRYASVKRELTKILRSVEAGNPARALYRIPMRGCSSRVKTPVTMLQAERRYGRMDVLIQFDAPGEGQAWVSSRALEVL